jgi:hypothetical protein
MSSMTVGFGEGAGISISFRSPAVNAVLYVTERVLAGPSGMKAPKGPL